MKGRKSMCIKWTLVLLVVLCCPYVYSRPQETSTSIVADTTLNSATVSPLRSNGGTVEDQVKNEIGLASAITFDSSRDVKSKSPIIRDSIKTVTTQLLEKPSEKINETPLVDDTRIPPKLKNQFTHKHKIKTKDENQDELFEKFHPGEAVPVTAEELGNETINESSTSNEGISTWILLSNPENNETLSSTEPTKTEEQAKKTKPIGNKNKNKRPQLKPSVKRPLIGSTNKSDLVAGGSAINENVYNKIKDTVLSNVQKNKNNTQRIPVTSTTISTTTTTSEATTYKNIPTKTLSTVEPIIKVTSKTSKKSNKNKIKLSSTTETILSSFLPVEAKEQEIELEISTPATTTKKPKRSSTRNKTKTKKRKTSTPKPVSTESTISDVKLNSKTNKTKSNKTSKKPNTAVVPITSQIYNYFSREVMPSVGVGVLGLGALVGLASYFLYPFSTPVRRTFEVDKKDDLYRHNAEEYASEGHGQAEEEMLGTVLAGMPVHAKQKFNPYAGQSTATSRYPLRKEQDIRYRNVAPKQESNYNARYPQQKTGIAHGAVYPETTKYNPQQYETRHSLSSDSKYTYAKADTFPTFPAVEPIYAAPHTGSSETTGYESDSSNSVIYGTNPSSNSEFKPVYPFDTQPYSESTNNPITYPPTSMYLGSNDDTNHQDQNEYNLEKSDSSSDTDNKFVVGNIPKELEETATPIAVPEYGPRNLNRRKRHVSRQVRSVSKTIEEIIKAEKEKGEIFISNEIDESFDNPLIYNLFKESNAPTTLELKDISTSNPINIIPDKDVNNETSILDKTEIIESVSTIPLEQNTDKTQDTTNFFLYKNFPVSNPNFKSALINNEIKSKIVENQSSDIIAGTTTELESETTSTVIPQTTNSFITEPTQKHNVVTQSVDINTDKTKDIQSFTDSSVFESTSSSLSVNTDLSNSNVKPSDPEVVTYPPLNQENGFLTFLKRLIEFKYRLGLSILERTSDSLNRFLRNANKSRKV